MCPLQPQPRLMPSPWSTTFGGAGSLGTESQYPPTRHFLAPAAGGLLRLAFPGVGSFPTPCGPSSNKASPLKLRRADPEGRHYTLIPRIPYFAFLTSRLANCDRRSVGNSPSLAYFLLLLSLGCLAATALHMAILAFVAPLS